MDFFNFYSRILNPRDVQVLVFLTFSGSYLLGVVPEFLYSDPSHSLASSLLEYG